MSKIIQVKIAKGGVGKTFLTVQLSSLLAALDKKVLVLTTDPQNDVFGMLKGELSEEEGKKGLKEAVFHEDYNLIRLRENLYYIPLDFEGYFSPVFFEKLKSFLEDCKEIYDYIFIDSNPTPRTDTFFLSLADCIIIPTLGTTLSIGGVVSILKTVETKKIAAIVFNQFQKTRIQKEVYRELREYCPHLVGEPIPHLAIIEELVSKKKTIWEVKNKKLDSVREIIQELALKIL